MVTKLLTLLLALASAWNAAAQAPLDWVQPDEHVYNPAAILGDHHVTRLEESARQARAIDAVPLYAIALPAPDGHGGDGLAPDAFAERILAAFQAALAEDSGLDRDRAVAVILFADAGKIEIALGSGWSALARAQAPVILDGIRADYLDIGSLEPGLVECAARVVDMIQKQQLKNSVNPSRYYAAAGGFVALMAAFALWAWRRSPRPSSAIAEAASRQHKSLILRELKKGVDPNAFDDHGYTAAIYAAGQGDNAVLRELVEHGADLGLATAQGETPLYAAAQHGHAETVQYLLSLGLPVDPETVHRETPLLIAAREGHVPIVQALLAAGANVNQQDNRGWTALMIALREDHRDLVNRLLSHHVDVNLAPREGAGALMMAVKQEDEELVRRIIERGADVHHTDRDGMCALRIAVLRGNQPIARRLLNAGADVTAPFANKETPVQCAEREGHADLAAYLKKRVKRLAACMDILEVVARGDIDRIREIVAQVPHSVNVHSKSSRWTPLLIAVRARHLDIAEILLANGADVHARSTEGKAAIAYAVDLDDLAMVKALLEGGARIDQVDPTGIDLRGYAEQQDRPAIVEFIDSFRDQQAAGHALFTAVKEDDPPKALSILKERPLCVDARTRHERWTPLLHAVREDNANMAKLLLEFNAQVDLANSRGMTPLMYAARNGNIELVRLLVNHGADVRLRSREGNTACEFALDRGHVRIVMLLQEVEAQLAALSTAGLLEGADTVADFTAVDGGEVPETGDRGRATDIFRAIMYNDLALARNVLKHWPECVQLQRGPAELTPLHMAINAGLYTLAEMLLEAGADVNATASDGKTPLFQAVARADRNLVSLLLNHGARVWHLVQGQTAIQVAQAAGYDDIVEELTRPPDISRPDLATPEQ